MPLPSLRSILEQPALNLPIVLHGTRTGGRRSGCSAARLLSLIAAGMVQIDGTGGSVAPDLPLPTRVGNESDDHRRLRAAARTLLLDADCEAVVGFETRVEVGPLSRRLDCIAITRFGVVAGFAGAVDGRDLAAILVGGRVSYCLVLPFAGLEPRFARGFILRNAHSPSFPGSFQH